MENSERTGEYNIRIQHLGDDAESLRTIDEIQDSNDINESGLSNIDYFDRLIASRDNVGSQGLNQTSSHINTGNLRDLNEIIRRQIEIREAEKSRKITNLSARVPEKSTVPSRATSSEA